VDQNIFADGGWQFAVACLRFADYGQEYIFNHEDHEDHEGIE